VALGMMVKDFWLLLIFCGTGGMMLETSSLVESMNFVPTLPQLGPIKTRGELLLLLSVSCENPIAVELLLECSILVCGVTTAQPLSDLPQTKNEASSSKVSGSGSSE